MEDKKAVTLEQLEIAKNYIDRKDAENIKSADFVDNTIKFYTSEDKSGEAVAEFVLPEEMFLDGSKTELVSDFTWDITKYPKSTDPELDGKSVLVLAVKSVRTVRYSFISLDSVIAKLVGEDTESASISVAEDVISLDVKVSELSGNRIIIKNDGLYVGIVDNTPSWVVSTNDEVREMFAASGGGITLASMGIGDTVKIMENGEPVDYLIVHKGLPSDMYDESCNGVWVLREKAQSAAKPFSSTSAVYEDSDIRVYLNNEFYSSIDEPIRSKIKLVNLPSISSDNVFLLSAYEVGYTNSDNKNYFNCDGAKLSYFPYDTDSAEDREKLRCQYVDDYGKAMNCDWWIRSKMNSYYSYGCVNDYGGSVEISGVLYATISNFVRPAFILPYDITVDSNGFVVA